MSAYHVVCRRTVTQKWMKRQLSDNPKWNVFMNEVEKNAWKITLLTRLLPFPFGLINGLFAVQPPLAHAVEATRELNRCALVSSCPPSLFRSFWWDPSSASFPFN